MALLLLAGCSHAPTRTSLLNTSNLSLQQLEINTQRDTSLRLKGGAIINIPAGTLEAAGGSIARLEVKEALTIEAMLKAGLLTESDGKPLQSAGMIYINAAEGSPVHIRKPLHIRIPGNDIAAGMMLFRGETGNNGINWKDPVPLSPVNAAAARDEGAVLFGQLCASCHSATEKITAPALYGTMQRWKHDTSRVYAFTRGRRAFLSDVFGYSCCIFASYNGQVMPDFPRLTDEQLKDIYDYIDREGKKKWGMVPPELASNECNNCPPVATPVPKTQQGDYYPQDTSRTLFSGERFVYYDIKITTFGWYNVDAFLKEYDNIKRSQLIVSVAGAEDKRVNVFLAVPYYKVLIPGTLMKDGKSYRFFEADGSIPLPQNVQAYIVATGEARNAARLYYGQASFTTATRQALTVQLAPTSKGKLHRDIENLQLKGFSIKADNAQPQEWQQRMCDCY